MLYLFQNGWEIASVFVFKIPKVKVTRTMKKLSLRTKDSGSSFEIPVEFVDRYMAEASGLSLKVYLYLLRAALDPSILLSVDDMAELFDVTPNKVTVALHYWAEKGLLSLDYSNGELSDILLLPVSGKDPKEPSEISPEKIVAKGTPSSTSPKAPVKNASAGPVLDLTALLSDEGFSDILSLAEYYLKKPVTSTMREALGTVYIELDGKADLVEYLLEYCIDRGHTSPHYIKSVAKGWKEEGLTSIEAIRKKNAVRNKSVYGVMSAFGIKNREPVPSETDYILSWTSDFELPIILEACRRTMDTIHTPDFKYTNSILSRWKEAGVKSLSEIEPLDKAHASAKRKSGAAPLPVKKTAFHNFPERHTDYDAIFAEYQKTRGVV